MNFFSKSSISDKNWHQLYTPDFSFCYSFDLPEEIQLLEVQEINVKVNQGAYIYVNHPGHFFSPNTKTKVLVLPHEEHSMELDYTVSIRLSLYNNEELN
jgi:hypothetical protein